MTYFCCETNFTNLSKYDYHQKIIHQKFLNIKIGNENSIKIFKLFFNNFSVCFTRVGEVFKCNCQKYTNKNPSTFRKHAIKCLGNSINEVAETSESAVNIDGIENSEVTDSYIVNDKFLKEFNVVINLKHHLLICKTCKYVVEVDSVFNHVQRNHRSIIDCRNLNAERELEFLKYVRELDPMLNSNFNIETEEIIEGLEIVNGFQCLECQYLCVNLSVIQKHFRKTHCDLRNFNYEKCTIQTLFLQPDKKNISKSKKIQN